MELVPLEVYQYSISQAEENIIKQQNIGFIPSINKMINLIYAHILIHCIENKYIFDDDELININKLINEN